METTTKKTAAKTPKKGKAASPKPPKRPRPGQPPKFTDTKTMQDKIDSYFSECDLSAPPKPYTIAGLAYHLNMSTDSLRNYEKTEQFFGIVKRAKQKVEKSFEERLTGCNSTGSIFWLKNHAGYVDRQIQEHDISEGLAAELKAARKRAGL